MNFDAFNIQKLSTKKLKFVADFKEVIFSTSSKKTTRVNCPTMQTSKKQIRLC